MWPYLLVFVVSRSPVTFIISQQFRKANRPGTLISVLSIALVKLNNTVDDAELTMHALTPNQWLN